MERIKLLRNTYLSAYLSVLRDRGVDPLPMLVRHGIPADFEYLADFMLAAPMLHRFISEAVTCSGPGTISTVAGLYNAAHQPNPFSDSVRQSLSLADAIGKHNDTVRRYSPENRFDLTINGTTGLWRKLNRSPSAETETFCVANLIGHVRSMLDQQWRPLVVEVSEVNPRVLQSLPLYAGVEIHNAPGFSAIHIPVRALRESRNGSLRPRYSDVGKDSLTIEDLDFLESLRLVMKGYARVGDLSVESVACAAGTSRRTLQRRLRALDVSYSVLVDRVRFEVASDLLIKVPELGVTQIGYELGYNDPGSFSRAFKRYAGIAPAAYRRRFAPETNKKSA